MLWCLTKRPLSLVVNIEMCNRLKRAAETFRCSPNVLLCYAKARVLVRKIWGPEIWDGDILIEDPEDIGSAFSHWASEWTSPPRKSHHFHCRRHGQWALSGGVALITFPSNCLGQWWRSVGIMFCPLALPILGRQQMSSAKQVVY